MQLARSLLLLVWSLAALPAWPQLVLTEGTNIAIDVSPTDGRIAVDLLGSIWLIPGDGGDAVRIGHGVLPARNPRWSPDGKKIVYQTATPQQTQIGVVDVASGESESLSNEQFTDQQPGWHPDGERLVFSSERGDSGFDLWELDLPSRLSWRVSNRPGDETGAAWSANGRHLAYIHRHAGQWSLVIRRFAQPDETLLVSSDPLYAPSWRPDGSLLTYLRQTPQGLVVQMVILSEPPLHRTLLGGEDFFVAPVSWLDRRRFYYAADGGIRTREFDDRQSTRVHFTAIVEKLARPIHAANDSPQLATVTPGTERQVIRAARIFDGSGYDYRYAVDVLIEDGRIVSVEPRREWPDVTVLDLGESTLLPGFIDSYARLPGGAAARIGAEFLAYGVTTVVSGDRPDLDPLLWESADFPGPRLLRAATATESPRPTPVVLATVPATGNSNATALRAWQSMGVPVLAESWSTGLGLGADLLMGADSLPTSPRGVQYQDIRLAMGYGPVTLLSGMANAGTPGLPDLLDSRQATQFGTRGLALRRYTRSPETLSGHMAVVLGSKPSGLPTGLALHAEFRALQAAGLGNDQILKSAGVNAATALRVGGQIGVIAPGALADLVLVSGDPLQRVADALNIVAVVRNGRFYSLGGLLERAEAGSDVE